MSRVPTGCFCDNINFKYEHKEDQKSFLETVAAVGLLRGWAVTGLPGTGCNHLMAPASPHSTGLTASTRHRNNHEAVRRPRIFLSEALSRILCRRLLWKTFLFRR